MYPMRDSESILKMRQGVMLSCSLLGGSVKGKAARRDEVFDVRNIARRRKKIPSLKIDKNREDMIWLKGGGGGGVSLFDSFLGVPLDSQGEKYPIGEWGLHDFEILVKRKHEKPAKPSPFLLQPTTTSLPTTLSAPSFDSCSAYYQHLKRSVTPFEGNPDLEDNPLQCGHVTHKLNLKNDRPGYLKNKRHHSMRQPKHTESKKTHTATRIYPGFSKCVLMSAADKKLYLLSGRLGQPRKAYPAVEAVLWEIDPIQKGTKPLRLPIPAAFCDVQAMCSTTGKLYMVTGTAHGLAGDGIVWEYNTNLRMARQLKSKKYKCGTLIEAQGDKLYIVCGRMGGVEGCGCLYVVDIENKAADKVVPMDIGGFADAQAMSMIGNNLYVVFGSAFGRQGGGSLIEYNVKTEVRRVLVGSGFSEAALMTAVDDVLYIVCGAYASSGLIGSLWEVNIAEGRTSRKAVSGTNQLPYMQAIAPIDHKLYMICGTAFKQNPAATIEKGIWVYASCATQQQQPSVNDKLCFTAEQYDVMLEAFNKHNKDNLSLDTMRHLCETLQMQLGLPPSKLGIWKLVERDKHRYPSLGFTSMLRILFNHLPISELKHTKAVYELEKKKREQLEREKQEAEKDKSCNEEVKRLFDWLSGGSERLSPESLLESMSKHSVLGKEDIVDVFNVVDSESDGCLGLQGLENLFEELNSKEQETTASPGLYFQCPVTQSMSPPCDVKLSALLDTPSIDTSVFAQR